MRGISQHPLYTSMNLFHLVMPSRCAAQSVSTLCTVLCTPPFPFAAVMSLIFSPQDAVLPGEPTWDSVLQDGMRLQHHGYTYCIARTVRHDPLCCPQHSPCMQFQRKDASSELRSKLPVQPSQPPTVPSTQAAVNSPAVQQPVEPAPSSSNHQTDNLGNDPGVSHPCTHQQTSAQVCPPDYTSSCGAEAPLPPSPTLQSCSGGRRHSDSDLMPVRQSPQEDLLPLDQGQGHVDCHPEVGKVATPADQTPPAVGPSRVSPMPGNSDMDWDSEMAEDGSGRATDDVNSQDPDQDEDHLISQAKNIFRLFAAKVYVERIVLLFRERLAHHIREELLREEEIGSKKSKAAKAKARAQAQMPAQSEEDTPPPSPTSSLLSSSSTSSGQAAPQSEHTGSPPQQQAMKAAGRSKDTAAKAALPKKAAATNQHAPAQTNPQRNEAQAAPPVLQRSSHQQTAKASLKDLNMKSSPVSASKGVPAPKANAKSSGPKTQLSKQSQQSQTAAKGKSSQSRNSAGATSVQASEAQPQQRQGSNQPSSRHSKPTSQPHILSSSSKGQVPPQVRHGASKPAQATAHVSGQGSGRQGTKTSAAAPTGPATNHPKQQPPVVSDSGSMQQSFTKPASPSVCTPSPTPTKSPSDAPSSAAGSASSWRSIDSSGPRALQSFGLTESRVGPSPAHSSWKVPLPGASADTQVWPGPQQGIYDKPQNKPGPTCAQPTAHVKQGSTVPFSSGSALQPPHCIDNVWQNSATANHANGPLFAWDGNLGFGLSGSAAGDPLSHMAPSGRSCRPFL